MRVLTRSQKNDNMPMMASSTKPPTTPPKKEPPKLFLSPQKRNTPPVFSNTPSSRNSQAFQHRATTLSKFYNDFFVYLESINLLQSHNQTLPESEAARFAQSILKADKLSNSFWFLLRDIINHVRSLYLNGQDPQATLILGYSDIKIVVECPYCEELHEHRRVPDAGIGVPVIYPAGCGAFGRYRVVFPGDIDVLTGTLGKEAVGLQVHKSGAYWMTVRDEVPDLERFFVVKYRPKKSLPSVTKAVVPQEEVKIEVSSEVKEETSEDGETKTKEQMLFEAFQRLDIAEDKSYDPVPIPPTKHHAAIKNLQDVAKSCAEKLNKLDQIVGYYSKLGYTVSAERWKESAVVRETRNKVEREADWQMCTVSEGEQTRLLGLVESDGYRTVCSCIRGPNYPDISVVSGLVEAERLDSHLPLNNKQLLFLVRGLAKEIGHEFPKEIPKSASVVWKRELERKNITATSAEHWHACHAEKKMLVRFLIMHTTWVPEEFTHNIFKYRSILGKEAGVRSAFCLARSTKFWVSWDICDDCRRFIEGVEKKFGVYLSFQRMGDYIAPKKPALDEGGEGGKKLGVNEGSTQKEPEAASVKEAAAPVAKNQKDEV
ncbi:hypothetical protein TWF225_008241 [Orbilia oligospora]|uniref:Uncharacterized protein n=1 Tax=Orbilia oligospora TaxID=2813651 RepID=A0A7C8TX68_ORBOL|nr:hypothetical protein TWF751_000156 [Orbilia oligospora]KAF3194065.1 hypothetical protein TWF225_008241 [Orbilia oligospora]KAF3246506.1 hypothetical protein TWF128_008959 [Orbilia oligospora]KAF3268961.1 hypothetical protein TWF217_010244 [Orbilia oligospora]TGJ67691.1 hypothetical protein EYR41_006804 [Orbilia oligospora]